jgi:hypothetical protein
MFLFFIDVLLSNVINLRELCYLTARQYGEVVLPDAASGHDPDTLAKKLSRCKEGMAWFLQIQIQIFSKPGVSRYKFDRSQKSVKVQDIYCVQVRVSGCKFWQDLSWEQGAAKTMTNNLPILSVLWLVLIFFSLVRDFLLWVSTTIPGDG